MIWMTSRTSRPTTRRRSPSAIRRRTSNGDAAPSCLAWTSMTRGRKNSGVGSSRPGRSSMDIIELITADHDEAAKLIEELDQLAANDSRTSEAMRIAFKLAVALKTHAKAEERILYESMRTATPQLAELALEGPYEHQAFDLMLDKLAVHRPGPELRAILHVL